MKTRSPSWPSGFSRQVPAKALVKRSQFNSRKTDLKSPFTTWVTSKVLKTLKSGSLNSWRRTSHHPLDISNRSECRETLESDIAEYGAIYGVVNNVGITRDTAFPAMTEEEWWRYPYQPRQLLQRTSPVRDANGLKNAKAVESLLWLLYPASWVTAAATNYAAAAKAAWLARLSHLPRTRKRKITVNCVV